MALSADGQCGVLGHSLSGQIACHTLRTNMVARLCAAAHEFLDFPIVKSVGHKSALCIAGKQTLVSTSFFT